MMVLKFMQEAVTGIPLYYRAHKFTFVLTMILALIIAVYELVSAANVCKRVQNPVLRAFLFVVFSLGSLSILLSAVVFNIVGEIAELKPEMLNRRFFLEIIVVTIAYLLYYAYVISLDMKESERTYSNKSASEIAEKSTEDAKKFLQGAVILIASAIFMFAGTGIVTAGPVIFNRTLGNWVFSLYAGWATSIIITFFAVVIQVPLIFAFGNKIEDFFADYEAMEGALPVILGILVLGVTIMVSCALR